MKGTSITNDVNVIFFNYGPNTSNISCEYFIPNKLEILKLVLLFQHRISFHIIYDEYKVFLLKTKAENMKIIKTYKSIYYSSHKVIK